MGRAIVLFACLMAAGVIAAYTHFSARPEATPVYTVRVADPVPAPQAQANPEVAVVAPKPTPQPITPTQRAIATPGDRASLARELQRELKRVGCYSGDISGVWTTSSRMAMKSFTDHVNASLPIDNPDYVLLSLVQGHQDRACNAQTNAKAETSPEPKTSQVEKTPVTTSSIVPAAATAATALAATAAIPKTEPKAAAVEERPRPVATPPASDTAKTSPPDRPMRNSGPVPSERVYERRQRRYSNNTSRPPKFVRNLFRALGIN